MDLVSVRMQRQFVEKYKKENALHYISEGDKGELIRKIAPIVKTNDTDEAAKRFDNFIFGMMLSEIEDLPGFKKDEINIQLDNGYLSISAAKGLDKDEQDKEGKYIRKERYAGSMSRSFYVGNAITQDDIKAKYESGILRLSVPKKAAEEIESAKRIAIEG